MARMSTAKSCRSDATMQASSMREEEQATVSNKPGHRGEREVSRKTIARGMPGRSGVTVVTMLVCLFFTHEAAGASRARHSLRPLMSEGQNIRKTSGASRRENADAYPLGSLKIESETAPERALRRPARAHPLRIELGIPVQIVEPAVVQIVRRKQPAVAMQLMHRPRERGLPRKHPTLVRRQVSLAQIARRTRGDHIFPGGLATFAARDDVIEGEIVVGGAILADEAVAQEHVEPGEGGMRGGLDEGFQGHHARQLDLERGAAHRAVIVLDDVDAIEKHRLDRVLPRPERQRIVTQRPEVRIQHQNRPTALRDMCVQVTLLAPILAAKQLALTYYRQRDGIVKSISCLYPPPRGHVRIARSAQRPLNEADGTFWPHSDTAKCSPRHAISRRRGGCGPSFARMKRVWWSLLRWSEPSAGWLVFRLPVSVARLSS